MYNKFEIILTIAFSIISLLLLLIILFRLYKNIYKRKGRIPLWHNEVSVYFKVTKILLVISLIFLLPGVIYYLFVVFLGSSTVRDFARYFFILSFILWVFLEIYFCFSISEKFNKGGFKRKIFIGLLFILSSSISIYLFSVLIKTYPFPPEEECVVLELPFNGIWIAGHAGASLQTNPHYVNKYAIDFLKLGSDNRFYKEKEDSVTDFYSYNEPVLSPANAIVTQIVDSIESDLMFHPDTINAGGNFIILDVGNEKYVFLGHLKKESIAVKTSDTISLGTYIGRLGNSGNSSVPHLHMHVQNKPILDQKDKITYPFRFNNLQRMRIAFWRTPKNAYLLRNDRIKKIN